MTKVSSEAAAKAALAQPNLHFELLKAVADLPSLRYAAAELAGRPQGQPQYRHRSQEGLVRARFVAYRTAEGIGVLMAALLDAELSPVIAEIVAEAHAYSSEDGRLESLDRDHDIEEIAALIGSAAEGLAAVRRRIHDSYEPWVKAPKRRRLIQGLFDAWAPQIMIQALAEICVSRWMPAFQNIISRLPREERQAAADDAQEVLHAHIRILGKLHTLAGAANAERERWDRGFGAADAAIALGALLLDHAAALAARMVEVLPDTEPRMPTSFLGRRVQAARDATAEHLQVLARERAMVLRVEAWTKHRGEMAEFAQADGGMAPELEVLYHTSGSAFLGC